MAKQAAMKPNRFNAARCWDMFQNDEDFLLLMELATKGAIIDPDLQFILQHIPEELRHTEVALAKVFQAHAISSWMGKRQRSFSTYGHLKGIGSTTPCSFKPFTFGLQV